MGSAQRILVVGVDDDDTIRETVAEALEVDGFNANRARNGAEALDRVRRQTPNGIILDLTMPVMTGWQFLDCCRATGVCKPFDLDVLLGAIGRAVRARPS